MSISPTDLQDLKRAKNLLETPGLAIKLANLLGMPMEEMLNRLPSKWTGKLEGIIQTALTKAADAAIHSLKDNPGKESSDTWHKVSVAVTGGVSGLFGLAALGVELPISTTLMMRSIVDIARSEGEDIKTEEAKLACLEVFALGGTSTEDDNAEFGYYGVRAGLAYSSRGIAEKGANFLAKFIGLVGKRFGSTVIHKLSAQAVPIVGGAGGALINTLFMNHYQEMARGHFIIRRLERTYGPEIIKDLYKTA